MCSPTSESVGYHGGPRGKHRRAISNPTSSSAQITGKGRDCASLYQVYTHVMAATSYPTSPSIHAHAHAHASNPPSHARTQSILSTALPSQQPTSHQPRGAPPSPDPCLCPHARDGAGSPHAPEPRSVCATRRRRHAARVHGARYTTIGIWVIEVGIEKEIVIVKGER
jgi:hypothetical protein